MAPHAHTPSPNTGLWTVLGSMLFATTFLVALASQDTSPHPNTPPEAPKRQPAPPHPANKPLAVSDAAQAAQAPTAPPAAPVEDPSMPGVTAASPNLDAKLAACLNAKGADYIPRTEHLTPDGAPQHTNRLICETSPYLLQHAHNPVNWSPWSEAAFERARARNVPVLLSVGYATCHWCHVMERESFEDAEIATFINRNFVAIKVDREERPDVDEVYMAAVQLLTGRGGWPMTVVLTPDRAPFFGGTYFPPRATARRQGFLDILRDLSRRYRDAPDATVAQARQLTARLTRGSARGAARAVPTADAIDRAVRRITESFDPVHGGFRRAPKFPRPVTLELLLRYHRRTQDPEALRMVTHTLDRMARGGLYDHIGGGFHRYSTDTRWLVPHFEKMLYDNAQLAVTYLEAWQLTQRDDFRRVVVETLDYVAREMTAPHHAFYSATDADSVAPNGEYEEGWCFTWTEAELADILGEDDAAVARAMWATSPRGNFEGRNILHTPLPRAEVAADLKLSPDALDARIDAIRGRLYDARQRRPQPLLDDKILTAWNGLMISAFARAGFALGRPDYTARAQRAARFVLDHLRDDAQRLRRSHREGAARHDAVLDDHAFLIAGLLDLFEADSDPQWLRHALALQRQLDARFWDTQHGGYFLTASDAEALLTRPRPAYDGAEPAGNSVAALNLLRLSELTLDDAHRDRAERIFTAFGATLNRGGTGSPLMLAALDLYHDQPLEVVVATPNAERAAPLLDVLRTTYLPHTLKTIATPPQLDALASSVPYTQHKTAHTSGAATAYVCRRSVCDKPTSDPTTFAAQLGRVHPYTLASPRAPLQARTPEARPTPWQYDPKTDRHWHEGHGHWHKGRPPKNAR